MIEQNIGFAVNIYENVSHRYSSILTAKPLDKSRGIFTVRVTRNKQ